MTHPLRADPFVAAEIDEALAAYAAELTAEELEWMREQLAALMERDGELTEALQGAHPRDGVDESGERARLGVDDTDDTTRDVG